jgi:hypothetical protein
MDKPVAIRTVVRRSILATASRSAVGSRLRSSGLTVRGFCPRIVLFPLQIQGQAGFLPALTARSCHQSRSLP